MKSRIRRTAVAAVLSLLGAACLPHAARAQDAPYPHKPIKIIVPFPPAGSTDMVARQVAERLGRAMNANIIVDNKPGAGGNIGAAFVAKSPPDGYTLLLGTSATQSVNAHLFSDPGYDGIKDFAPISLIVKVPALIVINPQLPVRTLAELIAYTKTTPLSYGHPSVGSSKHLAAEAFRLKSGANITPIAYKGSAPMLNDLLGGHIKMAFDEPLTATAHIKAGTMIALAITGPVRWPTLPDVPRVAELGGALADFEITGWFGILAPAGTPSAIVKRLNQELVKVFADEEFRKLLYTQGAVPVGSSIEEYTDYIRAEYDRWGVVVRNAKIKGN